MTTLITNEREILWFANSLTSPSIPRKIWQTWKQPATDIQDHDLRRYATSWAKLNPGYRYELLTDTAAKRFVANAFTERPDITSTFERIDDAILRADVLRYLVILAEGGLYTDIDTECTKPIDTWLTSEFHRSSGLVLGIEYDATAGAPAEFNASLSICQWTFMARPDHPVMQAVVDAVIQELQRHTTSHNTIVAEEGADVGEITGPGIFTRAVLDSLRRAVDGSFEPEDLARLTQPKLFGDVLVLPVSAFGSGQAHSGSKPWGNEDQLLSHHFLMSWRNEHGVGW
ncbi:hypothetical protein LTR56_024280 [Elasticomyces elasticus]|nr:hypothetical protein LTR56_024280 [Elasticomyces elasticus]